jgi:type IV secretion system protein VirB8
VKSEIKSLKDYIESGEYFTDAKEWYYFKYIQPFSHRSYLFILTLIILSSFSVILLNINVLLPMVTEVEYFIKAETSQNNTAEIIRANQINNHPLKSVADIMIKNYVIKREKYNYLNLKKQFTFIKNNSTRIVFRRFYNLMNIDNPSSPVMLYEKEGTRNIKILSAQYLPNNVAVITFRSQSNGSTAAIAENMLWQATITYEIDEFDPYLSSGSRFNFTVTDYQLKPIEDKRKK